MPPRETRRAKTMQKQQRVIATAEFTDG